MSRFLKKAFLHFDILAALALGVWLGARALEPQFAEAAIAVDDYRRYLDPAPQAANEADLFGLLPDGSLDKASQSTKKVMREVLVTQMQQAKLVMDKWEEGVPLPALDQVKLRIDSTNVLLEYKF